MSSPQGSSIVTELGAVGLPGARWQPTIGPETTMLIEHKNLPNRAGDVIQQAAASILGRGISPQETTVRRTGLVVGYVQSGKTLSFTTVIALARDNSFPVVIVVAGTSAPLLNQTDERLLEDLQVNRFDGPPRWVHIKNPEMENRQIVERTIADWRDSSVPQNEKATLLLTVMKQHQRLQNMNALLEQLDLAGVPILIVDDEADQASLNTKVNQGEESTTYERILELRNLCPLHTFLQYTATPQAPLLINIIDNLSPEFVEILEPGEGYVGGVDFFSSGGPYARLIPPNEIPDQDNLLTDPPDSLLRALAVFMVGVAAGLIEGWSPQNPNRSMLVHPSRTTDRHFQYFQSISAAIDEWRRILALPERDEDRVELVSEFRRAYDDLTRTVSDLPAFAQIIERLPRALASTQIREINTRPRIEQRARGGRRGGRTRTKTPPIEWRQAYSWILVGGQAMDRGFTVKELTVTYMPRGTGVGNADTLQQRARFFGYKRRYMGYCRIWLEANAIGAFEGYVEHEEEMRDELRTLRDEGTALGDWKRRFVLASDLNPCRANVIQHDYARGNYSDDWYFPHMLKMSEGAIEANRSAVSAFVNDLPFVEDTQYPSRQVAQQHLICDSAPLEAVIGDLLVRYRVESQYDTQENIGLMLQLSKALEANPRETVRIYQMRPNFRAARRGLDDDGRIQSIRRLLQGPTRLGSGYSYPGDHVFRDDERLTIQVHKFDLTEGERPRIVRRDVPVIAIWVPERLSLDWITQHQPQ